MSAFLAISGPPAAVEWWFRWIIFERALFEFYKLFSFRELSIGERRFLLRNAPLTYRRLQSAISLTIGLIYDCWLASGDSAVQITH